jgi:hypothetical protein
MGVESPVAHEPWIDGQYGKLIRQRIPFESCRRHNYVLGFEGSEAGYVKEPY